MPRFSCCRFFALLLSPYLCAAQTSSSPNASPITPTFHAQSELVIVDVVATDKHGNAITDLAPSDFTLLEDGAQRPIVQFERHKVGDQLSAERVAPPLPSPAQFPLKSVNNYAALSRNGGLTILLVDVLNTDLKDQQFVRQQLIKMVEQVPQGVPVMMLVLARNLMTVVPPTTDRRLLVDAADHLRAMRVPLAVTETEMERVQGAWRFVKGQGASGRGGLPSGSSPFQSEMLFSSAIRAGGTFRALRRIAQLTANYPGRKNLVWLTGSVPGDLGLPLSPQKNGATEYSRLSTFWAELSRELAAARIAVYPVDVRGLRNRGADISYATYESTGLFQGDPGDGNLLQNQTLLAFSEQGTMRRLADETGGRAFLTNDVTGAVLDCMNDGTYYTLAIKPASTKRDGSYHSIEVRLARHDARLRYRRAYFHADEHPPRNPEENLLTAVAPDAPDRADLRLTASLHLPDTERKALQLDYMVGASAVKFETSETGSSAELKFLAIAYDEYGRIAQISTDTMQAMIPALEFDKITRNGLPARQQLLLSRGTYLLRIGVLDTASGAIGTVTVPNVVIRKQK